MNLTIHLVTCGVLLVAVIGLYLYRHWLENHEDHYIHLHNDSHDAEILSSQTVAGKRLEIVDKLKNAGLIAVILYVLAIIGMVAYQAWTTQGT